MTDTLTKSIAEEAAIACIEALAYAVLPGSWPALGGLLSERADWGSVVLKGRGRRALQSRHRCGEIRAQRVWIFAREAL